MADPALGIDRSTDTAGYSPFIGGDRPTADRSFRPASDATDSADGELAALIRLGTSMLEVGSDAEATECFRKALQTADQTLGSNNPDLILILNDLTRLYLKQSRFADAEPLLLRLLDMKRSKGEDHPEVATVLASLAGVRQSLGRHESAEQLWRRVLEIRERTLAPNHFAIATALEHLGDACAARGNIREALPAFQRALTIRERTLGESHPSLRTSRERIADLQLQAADDSLDPSQGLAAPISPERYRLLSGDHPRLSPPMPVTREPSAALAREVSYSAARQTRVVLQIPAAETVIPKSTPASQTEEPAAPPMANGAVHYRDALESIREEIEQAEPGVTVGSRISAVVAALTAFFTRRQTVAATIAIGLLLASLAFAKDHAWGELDQNPSRTGAPVSQLIPTPVPALTASALATPIRDGDTPVASASARTAAARPVAVKSHAEDRPVARKADEPSRSDAKKFSVPTLSTAVMSHLDSVVSKAGAASPREAFNVQPTAIAFGSQRSNFEAAEQTSGPTRARLIGELPTPRIPAQAAEIEGEVRVRFTVDPQGQPVMSTFSVVTSPSPLLTAAVRKVIPEMRFDPAHTGGADTRAIADVVETSFRFSSATR